jgi:hypothetical protein
MGDFLSNTFSSGNPNGPIGDSENMRLVRGQAASVEPLGPEPGNIWPGPIGPMPTLQDFEKNGFQPTPNGQPYAPDHREPTPQGSSTPPPTSVPAPPPLPQTVPPLVTAPPPQRNLTGQPVQTPSTSGVISSGTTGYQTLTTPQGPAVVVPNGNGTSTVIHSDGRVETIPTPGK